MDTNFVNKEDIIYEDELIELPDGISSKLEEDTEIYITKHITVKTIIHSLVPIEYPPTSERGIAIIYHIEGWENKDAVFSDVQYSIDLELKEMEHKSVDPDSDLCLKINQELSTSNKENNTFAIKDNVDLNLLSQLLNGLKKQMNHLFIATHPHHAGNIIKQGSIIRKTCRVKYTKIISHDLEKCSYIILISKGIHFHPPPLPNRVLVTIQDHLQELIRQANDDTVDTYFGTEYLANMHASLNNADRL
ncbi:unnamed protein product [Rhizophagus irregularis]|nr:unnamed protein product [Rhizophagus irregularis]